MMNKDQNQKPLATNVDIDAKRGNQFQPKTEQAKSEIVKAEIMKIWPKLSDEDARLHDRQKNLFFDRLKEKQGIGREEAQKRLDGIIADCGNCSAEAAA